METICVRVGYDSDEFCRDARRRRQRHHPPTTHAYPKKSIDRSVDRSGGGVNNAVGRSAVDVGVMVVVYVYVT